MKASAPVAIDTEADSLHAYPEKLCLIQLSFGTANVLVDPLAGLDLKPMLAILQGKELILHGADYDLRLLYRTFQFIPECIFDTMWAARLLGYHEFGLRDLVQRLLGVNLEKGPQKMNWAMRPLTERMATYALNDTRYLHQLADVLRTDLRARGRLEWHRQIGAVLIKESSQPRSSDPETNWRLGGSDRLNRHELAVLREIWRWRETEALSANKPPYFVMSHEKVLAIALAVAQGNFTRNQIPHHMPAKRVSRLLEAIDRVHEVKPSDYPHPRKTVSQRLSRDQQLHFEELKRLRDERALQLELDPTLIASKSDLIQLARHPETRREYLLPWQYQLLFNAEK